MVYSLTKCTQTHYHIYCKYKFIDGYVDASRVHAYNEELNQMWQESSFNLKTNHMENRKWDKHSTNWFKINICC